MTTKKIDETYASVCSFARETATLYSIASLLDWDESVLLPPGGAEHRAKQSSLLAGMVHRRWIDERFGEQLNELAESPLADDRHTAAGATIRELKRQRDKKVKLPPELVEELTHTAVMGQQQWVEARKNDDFSAFQPLLEKTLELKRQEADALGWEDCRYDALLDDYEPGEKTANVARVLEGLREALVPIVGAIVDSGRRPDTSLFDGEFSNAEMIEFSRGIAEKFGFDFNRGRLDTSPHPFCAGMGPGDCRITTRSAPRTFSDCLFSVLHETGHGIYEQGLPTEHFGLPPGDAISLGIHESQSRMWENQVGRSRAFWQFALPLASEAFPAFNNVDLDTFYFAVNDVCPSLIRTESDEATYNLHILVRFELEQALLDGDLPAADLREAWNEKYRQYLGIAPPNDADGVLQDVHWSAGLFGYFATYSLGNLYAAQFFAKADQEIGPLTEQFSRGEFDPLRGWLRDRIHSVGQCYTAAELVERVTGEPLAHEALIRHLKTKFSPLYELSEN